MMKASYHHHNHNRRRRYHHHHHHHHHSLKENATIQVNVDVSLYIVRIGKCRLLSFTFVVFVVRHFVTSLRPGNLR